MAHALPLLSIIVIYMQTVFYLVAEGEPPLPRCLMGPPAACSTLRPPPCTVVAMGGSHSSGEGGWGWWAGLPTCFWFGQGAC